MANYQVPIESQISSKGPTGQPITSTLFTGFKTGVVNIRKHLNLGLFGGRKPVATPRKPVLPGRSLGL